jgi:hypothetical protein
MNGRIDLKKIERKAFQSTFQDGLWDVYYGIMTISLSAVLFQPAEGYNLTNLLMAVATLIISFLVLHIGQDYITGPRMGYARFGKRRLWRLIIGVVSVAVVGVVILVITNNIGAVWVDPAERKSLSLPFRIPEAMKLPFAALMGSFAGIGMALIAIFGHYTRGYYIAILIGLAFFLMLSLNQPFYPILLGSMVLIPGVVIFIRFLKTHPRPSVDEASND